MKTILISLMLILVLKSSGQIPYNSNFSKQSSEIPKIELSHIDKAIGFNEKDSIVYTLNFKPDSVSKIDENKNFVVISPRANSSISTVNNISKIQSIYTYVFTPITTDDFKFPSITFYLNGQKYTTDAIQIEVKHRELTEEEREELHNYDLTNTLNNDDNTMQIVLNSELGFICARKNKKFVLIKELSKKQVKEINKIMNQ